MQSQSIRAGAGQQGWGGGDGVRATVPRESSSRPGGVVLYFQVPNPHVPGGVRDFHYMGIGAQWAMMAGSTLSIHVVRVRYPNGAEARLTPTGTWVLTLNDRPSEMTLPELLRLRSAPVPPH